MTMNTIRIRAVALLLMSLVAVGAASAQSVLTPAGETRVDNRTWLVFTGPGGLKVLAAAPMPAGAEIRISRVVSFMAGWTAIRPTEVRVSFSEEGDDYAVLVSSIESNGKQYAGNVPGGLRLRFAGALGFDFRVKSGEYFVRVRGVMMDDVSLAAEVALAADDPTGYIAARDLTWAASRIGELDARSIGLQDATASLADRAGTLENRAQAVEDRAVALEGRATTVEGRATTVEDRATKLEDRSAALELRAQALEDRAAKLEQQLAAAEASIVALRTELTTRTDDIVEKLRIALAQALNSGMFGSNKPVTPDAIKLVLEMKKANPAVDRVAVAAEVKKRGLKVSTKEIDIVFKVWFGE